MKFSRYFKYFLLGFIISVIVMKVLDKPKPGIIAFEFAKTLDNANSMIAIWESYNAGDKKIIVNLYDYVFMFFYGGSLFFFYKAWHTLHPTPFLKILMYFAVVAVCFDAVENYGLLKLQFKTGTNFHAQLAFYCASIKFALLAPCVLGIIVWGFITVKKN